MYNENMTDFQAVTFRIMCSTIFIIQNNRECWRWVKDLIIIDSERLNTSENFWLSLSTLLFCITNTISHIGQHLARLHICNVYCYIFTFSRVRLHKVGTMWWFVLFSLSNSLINNGYIKTVLLQACYFLNMTVINFK